MEKKTYSCPRLKTLCPDFEKALCLVSAETDTDEEKDFEPEAKEGGWDFSTQPHRHPSIWEDNE